MLKLKRIESDETNRILSPAFCLRLAFACCLCLATATIMQILPASAQSVNRLMRPQSSAYSGSATLNSVRLRTPEPPPSSGLNLDNRLIDSFKSPPPAEPRTASADTSAGRGLWAAPTIAQLKRISDHDVVVCIDKSGSMSTPDCPGDVPMMLQQMLFGGRFGGLIPRWDWCQRQTMHFASQMARIPGSKIKLVLFDSHVNQFDDVTLSALPDIFSRFRPGGSTNTTGAIKAAINDYFERKREYGHVKPLLIVCITDGAPDNPRSLKDLLINTTLKMESPSEISVVFLQVGDDHEGNRLLPELAFGLTAEGAQQNIVTYRDFPYLLRSGLLNSLIEVVNSQPSVSYR